MLHSWKALGGSFANFAFISILVYRSAGGSKSHYFIGIMSYTFVGDVYDRTTPIEMTQVNPEAVLPAKPGEGLQVPEIEDLSHISLHQVKKNILQFLEFIKLFFCLS